MFSRSRRSCLAAVCAIVPLIVFAASTPSAKEKKEKEDEGIVHLTPFEVSSGGMGGYSAGSMGATPGGAKDIRFFRSGATRGQIPQPSTFTAEGLFSEHDLPLEMSGGGEGLFRVQTAATVARFDVLPEVRYLAQLGLSSGLKAETWQPAPLNLVAVVDKSGSMSGEPLALVRASLASALDHMRDGDQISIVLYGDRAHVHLPTTVVGRATRSRIASEIAAIESLGSTNMEAGLKLGYQVARESKAEFSGTTRVMLFTDEQPNVGDTSAAGFMGMAEAASRDGVGLTTIGVGVHFGAELATRISSVRGGNLFFFPDRAEMRKVFAKEWDTIVTELAHDFRVRIEPARGYRLAGVFGLPDHLLRWDGDALVLDIATIFVSQRKGAIYFAVAPDRDRDDLPRSAASRGDVLADVSYSYREVVSRERRSGQAACRFVPPADMQAGLSRGIHLIDQYLTLKKAAQLHHLSNDPERAFQLASGLLARFSAVRDPALAKERDLVREFHNNLAFLSGHASEVQYEDSKRGAALVGTWRRTDRNASETAEEYLVVWPNGDIETVDVARSTRAVTRSAVELARPLPSERSGVLKLGSGGRDPDGEIRFEISGENLRLRTGGRWGGETSIYRRGKSTDIPNAAAATNHTEKVDEFSGLPGGATESSRSPADLLRHR